MTALSIFAFPMGAGLGAMMWVAFVGEQGGDTRPRLQDDVPSGSARTSAGPAVRFPLHPFEADHTRTTVTGGEMNPDTVDEHGIFLARAPDSTPAAPR